jgi:nucleoside-specific outer membrane channel protein Tsx
MLLVICPFTKYDMGSKLLNRYNTNSKHVRLDMAPMPVLQLTYNLQWGHQKRNASRLVESNSSVDKSSVGGR